MGCGLFKLIGKHFPKHKKTTKIVVNERCTEVCVEKQAETEEQREAKNKCEDETTGSKCEDGEAGHKMEEKEDSIQEENNHKDGVKPDEVVGNEKDHGEPRGHNEDATSGSTLSAVITVKPAHDAQDNTDVRQEDGSVSVMSSPRGEAPTTGHSGIKLIRVRPKAAKGPRTMPRTSLSSAEWSKDLFDDEHQSRSINSLLDNYSPFLDKRRRPKAAKGKRFPMWMQTTGYQVGGGCLTSSLNEDPLLIESRRRKKLAEKKALEAWSQRVKERE